MSHSTMIFPTVGKRSLSAIVHFVGTAVLSICLARRVAFEDLGTLRGWKHLTVARLALILVFALSLAFIFGTSILIHGVGLEYNGTSCSLAMFSCILLYAATKVLIYIFLSERVWLVWSSISASQSSLRALEARHNSQLPTRSRVSSRWRSKLLKRLKNPVYLVALLSVLGYPVILVLLIVYRIAYFRPQDGACVIGIGPGGTIPLLTYDAYLTILLTTLFVWPLRFRKGMMSEALRRLTVRTLLASFAALATSAANIAGLTVMHGQQLGWVCLASCGSDVMLNALVLDLVTESRLKKLVKSRTGHSRPVYEEEGLSSFPTSPTGAKHATGTNRTRPRPSYQRPLGGSLDLGYNAGTQHSVDLQIRSEGDIKSPDLTRTPSMDDLKFSSRPIVPSNLFNNHQEHTHSNVEEPFDCVAHVDAGIEMESRTPSQQQYPTKTLAPPGSSRSLPTDSLSEINCFDRAGAVSTPTPSGKFTVGKILRGFHIAGGGRQGSSISLPHPQPVVISVSSTSETVAD
ncbi:hypothetical protein DL93DRAFT_2230764 [Clavulina sp. PMI_390]|nr:hypothetical protein DL93DRAFT_2230764 [Clavulina sp. PMI_390]